MPKYVDRSEDRSRRARRADNPRRRAPMPVEGRSVFTIAQTSVKRARRRTGQEV